MTLPEKLAWTEEAHRLARRLDPAHDARPETDTKDSGA